MDLLKKRILQDGKCFEDGLLKWIVLLMHQMDPILMKSIGWNCASFCVRILIKSDDH